MMKRMVVMLILMLGMVLSAADARVEAAAAIPGQQENGPDFRIAKLELKQSKVADAIRLISELSGINAVATDAARRKEVSLYLQGVTARQAMEHLAKISGLWYREEKETGTFKLMTTEEFQKELVVLRDDQTSIFNLLHHNTVGMAKVVADLYGDRVILSLGEEETDDFAGTLGFGAGISTQASQFSRPVSGQTFEAGDGRGRAGSQARGEEKIKESLTSEQIARLMERLESGAAESGEVPSAALRGISSRETPIFVTVLRQHNALVVRTDDTKAIADIDSLIKNLDRPTPQVLLEMKLLKLGLGDSFRSIFDFSLARGQVITGPPTGQPPNPLVPNAVTSPQNILGLGNFPLEGGTFIYQFMNDHIRARIQLLAQENRLEVVATPMILASNNRPSRLFVGEQRVLVTGVKTNVITPATGAATTVVEPVTEVRDIGNTLLIQPKINADRTVTLFVSQDSSTVLRNSATIPVATQTGDVRAIPIDTVDTAILQGTIVARDGLTVAVGGLIQKSYSKDEQKVPLLGDLPLFGRIFRREVKDEAKSELVLLITPYVLMTPEEGKAVTDARLRELSEHPGSKAAGGQELEGAGKGEKK